MDETGKQHYLDATIAFKRAVLNCIDYLSKFGYTKRQARCVHTRFPVPTCSLAGWRGEIARTEPYCVSCLPPLRPVKCMVSWAAAPQSCCLLTFQCLPSGASSALLDQLTQCAGAVVHLQIYLLLSCCPCEGRVSGIVDVPNACCTLAIPTAIFDQARPIP